METGVVPSGNISLHSMKHHHYHKTRVWTFISIQNTKTHSNNSWKKESYIFLWHIAIQVSTGYCVNGIICGPSICAFITQDFCRLELLCKRWVPAPASDDDVVSLWAGETAGQLCDPQSHYHVCLCGGGCYSKCRVPPHDRHWASPVLCWGDWSSLIMQGSSQEGLGDHTTAGEKKLMIWNAWVSLVSSRVKLPCC